MSIQKPRVIMRQPVPCEAVWCMTRGSPEQLPTYVCSWFLESLILQRPMRAVYPLPFQTTSLGSGIQNLNSTQKTQPNVKWKISIIGLVSGASGKLERQQERDSFPQLFPSHPTASAYSSLVIVQLVHLEITAVIGCRHGAYG